MRRRKERERETDERASEERIEACHSRCFPPRIPFEDPARKAGV